VKKYLQEKERVLKKACLKLGVQAHLDEQDNLKIEFVNSLINTAGKVTFNALREIVKRDEERVAATMMYLLWAADAAQLQLFNSEMPKITAINLFETKNIFMTSDVALAVISFILRKLIEEVSIIFFPFISLFPFFILTSSPP